MVTTITWKVYYKILQKGQQKTFWLKGKIKTMIDLRFI